ncbi:MAG: sigma-70 family RNA polymerase sigma factor [Planctomycetaceae bacterium]|jgi:RNA polymerase sigma factor (sigma-70 family)|nr:MAG: sigma-70 family RNA polymerase sigma factor [Planctomycetaceae bacterium]
MNAFDSDLESSDESLNPFSQQLSDCLERLHAGEEKARDEIVVVCAERLQIIAHRLLKKFPRVRRWNDTDDIFQGGALRLYRSLASVHPSNVRELLGLATLQMHRELLDLARRYSGPTSYAANHDTNVVVDSQGVRHIIDSASDRNEALERWTLFHETVERLPEEQREVFRLVWYLNADQAQISRLLNCSTRTVKRHWQAARQTVREALNNEFPDESR